MVVRNSPVSIAIRRLLERLPTRATNAAILVSEPRLGLLSVLALSILLIALRFDEYVVGSVTDDAVYAELARSLAEGRGPRIHLSDCVSYEIKVFPLGYPAVLSPVAYLMPDSLTALKLVSAAAVLLLFPVHLWFLEPLARPRERVLLAALVLLNPWTVAYATRVLSEATYTLCSLAALLAHRLWLRRTASHPIALLLAALIGLLASVRIVGLCLVAGVVLDLAIGRQWRRLSVLIPGLAVSMAPQVWVNGGDLISQSYQTQLTEHARPVWMRLVSAAEHFSGYLKELPAAVVPVFGNRIQSLSAGYGLEQAYVVAVSLLGLLLLLLVITGFWRLSAGNTPGWRAVVLYHLFYAVALLNFQTGDLAVQLRLLVPLLPFLYLGLLRGMMGLGRRIAPARGRRLAPILLLAVLPLSLLHNSYRVAAPMRAARTPVGRGFVDYSAGAGWVRANTSPGEVVMTDHPLERHIHMGRPTVGLPAEPSGMPSRIRECDVRYVLSAPGDADSPDQLSGSGRGFLAALRPSPDRYVHRFADPDRRIHVFEVCH